MNEKYKNLFKKLGLAGFLFFLIKGILWLVFGTALFKWLKGCVITGALLSFPLCIYSQQAKLDSLFSVFKHLSIQKDKTLFNYKNQNCERAFFCKLEDHYLLNHKLPMSFRLGSAQYTNAMEYPNQWRLVDPAIKSAKNALSD